LSISPNQTKLSKKHPSDVNFNKKLIYMFLKKIIRVAMLFLPLLANGYCAGREQISLVSDWKFLQRDIAPDENRADWKSLAVPPWEIVSIPHTWNAVDGANGREVDPSLPEGYYRGPAWYERALPVPADWRSRRVFIRFEGVSLVADVFINRMVIGQHRGAFGAFCFEVTPYLKFDGSDSLRVRVDNARALDVAPLSGDFTVFGGIYRPVEIFSTGDACINHGIGPSCHPCVSRIRRLPPSRTTRVLFHVDAPFRR
jgi:hypothetical protein